MTVDMYFTGRLTAYKYTQTTSSKNEPPLEKVLADSTPRHQLFYHK